MTKAEREAFLADVRIGVFSVPDGDNEPLSAPIWYLYEPGGDLELSMGPNSRKAKLISVGARVSLVVQTETAPYKYVSVAGEVTSFGPSADPEFTLKLASRYLGAAEGKSYAAAGNGESVVATVRIDRWMTTDYGKR